MQRLGYSPYQKIVMDCATLFFLNERFEQSPTLAIQKVHIDNIQQLGLDCKNSREIERTIREAMPT
jgi:hypothetical protein